MSEMYVPSCVLVTGGAGFIGSHVIRRLLKEHPEYKVINLDCLDYCASLVNVQDLERYPNYRFVRGNICDKDFVMKLMVEEEVDTVMHFAAQSHVDNSFGTSLRFTETNIYGTHVLLEVSKLKGINRFIHVSTDEVYGENSSEEAHHQEDMILAPTNPYAATKAAAEFLVKSYSKSFGLPVIITRGNNVYGPCQYPEKLIPKFICRLLRGLPLCIHGDGQHRRSFLYVEDAATAFLRILHAGTAGTIYNVGTHHEVSNMQVAQKLLELFGVSTVDANKHIRFVEDRKYNDRRYAIDSRKLHALGWRPKITWEEGLSRTIDWYRGNSGNWGSTCLDIALREHPLAADTKSPTNDDNK